MFFTAVMPATSTGVALSVVVPSPSWPWELDPQHITFPSVSRTHECCEPWAMFFAVVMPATSTGPSWPLELDPQHFTFPSVSTAQL